MAKKGNKKPVNTGNKKQETKFGVQEPVINEDINIEEDNNVETEDTDINLDIEPAISEDEISDVQEEDTEEANIEDEEESVVVEDEQTEVEEEVAVKVEEPKAEPENKPQPTTPHPQKLNKCFNFSWNGVSYN